MNEEDVPRRLDGPAVSREPTARSAPAPQGASGRRGPRVATLRLAASSVAALLGLGVGGTDALAQHHIVKRALQTAGCIPAQLRQIPTGGGTLVYEARCRGGADRVVNLVCTPTRCLVDEHSRHADEEDEP